jgi:hypothetical protein
VFPLAGLSFEGPGVSQILYRSVLLSRMIQPEERGGRCGGSGRRAKGHHIFKHLAWLARVATGCQQRACFSGNIERAPVIGGRLSTPAPAAQGSTTASTASP